VTILTELSRFHNLSYIKFLILSVIPSVKRIAYEERVPLLVDNAGDCISTSRKCHVAVRSVPVTLTRATVAGRPVTERRKPVISSPETSRFGK